MDIGAKVILTGWALFFIPIIFYLINKLPGKHAMPEELAKVLAVIAMISILTIFIGSLIWIW